MEVMEVNMKLLLLFGCMFFVGIVANNRVSTEFQKCIKAYSEMRSKTKGGIFDTVNANDLCDLCLLLDSKQSSRCIKCITDRNVILKRNESWCDFYALSGNKALFKELQTKPYIKN